MAYKKIGLALSGGGARGLAHIGVLKVLEEENIPIHSLSGCSMGAILAAGYARGYSAVELEQHALSFSSMRRLIRLVNLSPARRGWLESGRVQDYLEKLFGKGLAFEHLRMPLVINSVDLVSGKEILFYEGPVLPAVMASMAVPGIFKPVCLGDLRLVDGGVLNNLPVGPARSLKPDVVIGVDVQVDPLLDNSWTDTQSRRHSRMPVPASFREIYRSILIMIAELKRYRFNNFPPDLLLNPPLPPDLDMFLGFPRAAEAIAAGEKGTRKHLKQIKQLIQY